MTNSMRLFMQIRAMTFTPSDSPSMSPETMAILALQEDLAKPHPMSLALRAAIEGWRSRDHDCCDKDERHALKKLLMRRKA